MFGLSRGDQLTLGNAAVFIQDQNSLDNLFFFVSEVELKSGLRQYDQIGFKKAETAFEKGASLYGAKIIRPFRILLMRVLKQNLGFIELHVEFLKMCKKYEVPKEALPILQYPGYFKHASKNTIAQFLRHGCDIYIKLKRYTQALQLLNRGSELQFLDTEVEVNLMKRRIVLHLVSGQGINLEMKERMKIIASREQHVRQLTEFRREIKEMKEIKEIKEKKEKEKKEKKETQKDKKELEEQAMLQFFYSLEEWRNLLPEEQAFLKPDGLLEPFNDSKGANLGGYIKDNVQKNNWRIKAAQIKGCQLDNLEIVKGVNLCGQIYRYDCKNKIMYFNHKNSDQEKLNDMITKAFNMSEEVVTCKIDRKESDMARFKPMMGGGGRGPRGFGGMGMGGMMDMMSGMMGGRRMM